VILPTTTEFCLKLNLYKYFHVNNGNRKRFDVRVKALTVLDAHSIRIKRTWERRINERVWKWHNAVYSRKGKKGSTMYMQKNGKSSEDTCR
jgi:hypothetical protein